MENKILKVTSFDCWFEGDFMYTSIKLFYDEELKSEICWPIFSLKQKLDLNKIKLITNGYVHDIEIGAAEMFFKEFYYETSKEANFETTEYTFDEVSNYLASKLVSELNKNK